LVTGTVGVAIIYVLLNAVFVLGPSVAQVVGRPDIAVVAARELGGWWFEEMVRWTIVLCLTTSVLSMMMAAPRVYARMAQDGLLPGWLKLRGQSPALATIAQVVIAIVLLVLSDLQGLLSYLGLTLSLSAALSVACLLLPSMQRQWRLKVGPTAVTYYLVPLLYVLSTLICAAMLAYRSPAQILGSVVTFSIGAVAYLVSGRSGV
jgi:APA family basic amino acid/polyamine antiporter